jgi:hypothetical protein
VACGGIAVAFILQHKESRAHSAKQERIRGEEGNLKHGVTEFTEKMLAAELRGLCGSVFLEGNLSRDSFVNKSVFHPWLNNKKDLGHG